MIDLRVFRLVMRRTHGNPCIEDSVSVLLLLPPLHLPPHPPLIFIHIIILSSSSSHLHPHRTPHPHTTLPLPPYLIPSPQTNQSLGIKTTSSYNPPPSPLPQSPLKLTSLSISRQILIQPSSFPLTSSPPLKLTSLSTSRQHPHTTLLLLPYLIPSPQTNPSLDSKTTSSYNPPPSPLPHPLPSN